MSTKLNQQRDHYSLRKFKSAGLASALIGVSTISFLLTNNKPVKAAANSSEPNEEANNDAMHKEQQDDIQSGTTTTTTETRQAPTTKITPLKPKKQTDKQESAKEQTKPEESKPKEEPEQAKKPVKQVEENKTAKTKKQAQTTEAKTPVEKQPNKNGSETKKQQKEDSKNILKDLTKTNAKLHQSLTNIKSNDDSSVDPIATETSDDAKQTATQKPVKIDLETQDFVLPRKRVSRLGVNMLAMNLAAMPAEQHNPTYPQLTKDNWKDPASWGMIKSNAGWTYSVPKYVADSSQSYFCDVNKNKFEGKNVIGLKDQPATYRTHLSADISTDTANESVNQDVLVASMPILNNDPMTGTPGHTYFIPSFGFKFNMNHGVYDQKGNYIGYLWYNVEKNNDMKIYWRNTGKNYSDKVHIDFDFDSVNMDKGWPDNYQYQAKTGKEFDIEFVNPDGTFSNWREVYNPAQDDHPWQDNANSLNVYVSSPSPYWRNAYLNVGLNQSLDKADVNQSTFKKVEQVYAYNNKGNIVKINSASNAPHFRTYSKITDGTNTFSGYRYDLYTLGMARLADNLSAQEVYDQTPAHSVSYSAQSDGSILMGYNFTLSDAHYSEQNVRDTVESEYYFNYQHPEEKQKWIDATIAAMKKRNWTAPNVGDIETYLNWNSDDVTTMSSLDVTPGISGQLQTSRSEENAGGSEAAYQQMATINFIDDDDNGKVISHQLIAGPQDKTKTFNTNVPDRYVLLDPSQYTISHHFVYKDNSVINIHVKHKIIGNVSDLHENAHNERDYFIDQVRSKADPNITIIQDQDQNYQAKYNDVNDQNDKINQISQDYINQTTTIANQIEDYNKKLADGQQPPKLELHYHNDNLQLTKTSTYQVIEKMPSPKYGKDQTILKTTITAGKDIARDLVTGKTQETQFTGRNTHGNVEVGQTDGVDQTVIWGKQPTIIGYHFNPFQAETKEHFDHVGGTDSTDHGAILSVSSTDNTIHFDYLVGQNYQSATNLGDSLILSDLPDSQTWYVTLSPNQQNTQVIYVDDDANGKQVGSQAISGLTDQETDHIFLDQFDHSKYTIDGNHLSKSDIQSDQLDGSITSYNVYEQTSPDYANYNFVNIYNKHNNQWTNVTSDSNNRLIIHLKEKTIGTTDPGNIIDPIHNLKGENVGPNITWIQDPNRETVVNDDQTAIDNALNNIANDYNTQEESIRNQLKDYYNRLDEYNQRRQDFIKDLKAKGYWNDSYIDLTNAGQHLQLDHDENNVMQIESLDPNFATVNGHMINVKPNVDHQGEFAKVTYTNLSHAFYDNKPISKIEVYYGDWYYSNMSGRDYCGVLVGSDLAGGYTFNHSTGLRVRIKLFNQNGNQIKLDKQSFLTLGSLNSGGPGGIESVKLLSKGKAYAIPGSSVTVHDGNWLYSDQANGTWNGVGGWDTNDPTDPKYSIGAGLFDITGDTDIIIHDYSGDVTNVHNRNSGVGAKWATTLTTIPPMAFEEKAPTLTIHYHTNSLRSNTNRKYSVTYTYPPEVSSYYDNYTYADIVQAHRYAGKNLVTGQKTYSHYYGDRVSDDITQNKALRLNWNNIYGFTTKSDIPDGAIINNNQGIAITKDHMAFNNDFDNLADSYNYHIYYTPGEVLAKAQFIDEDTGQLVQENPFYGYVGQTVDVSNIPVPKNYRIADDSSKPDTYKMLSSGDSTAPDDQGFIVYVVQDTQTVQDAPRNIHIVVNGHDNLSGDITYTRDGIYNKVTGQTTWNPWTVYNSSASLNGMTDMYTLNGADITDLENNNINYTIDANGSRIANGTLTQDNSNYNLALSPDSPYFDGKTDLTYVINLNTVPANKEQYIIYEDRETHEQLGESSIKGPVGSQQPYTVKHFDGYLDPQGLPPTLEIKEDDTPYVIYLDRLAVYIPANNPVNEGDSVHAYDGDYVGDDTFPGGLNEGALNHYVTRTIYVTKNGQTTKNVTTYHFTRNAYYYPANGEIKYTDWSEDQTFPVFKLDHNGVTPIVEGSQTDANGDIPAVTVGANDSDITIDVSYESNDKGITLIWQDSDMSNREIRRHNMSIDQFKQSDTPEKAVLPDFKYTDEDHPQTFNDYSKNFNFKLEDTDGNILAQGDLSNLKSVGSLLKEKNNGYLLIFSKAHGYQYVQNSPNDEYPPIKSTYRIVNVTFPDGQTVQFRYGTRWKLADRRRDMTTGIKNAISNEGYIPASYIGTKDGTYPEINDEFIKNLLIQNGYVDDLSGYTIKADGDTSFMSLNADSPNEVVNVSFVGKRAGTKVEIVDTAGNVLAYNYLVGHIGQTLDINYPDIPAGYSNAGYAYYPKTYTFTKEHPDPIVVRVAKTGYANGQSVPTDNNLTTNSNSDTRSNSIKHANMFTSLFVMPQNQGQSSGASQNNKPHSLQDQLQNLKTSKQQKHFNQSRSNAQPKQDFTQAQGQAPKPKQDFTRVKPNKIDHNNAMDASLFVKSRGSSTAKLDDSHQDLLSKLSNLGAPKAAPVKHSNAQPVNTSSINHNFTTNQNLAQKLSNLKKTSYVQDRSVNVDPESSLDPTVEAATVEQDKTNAKDQTKKPDHSKEALVASLLGLSSAATAGAYTYKKKKNVKDETFNK